MEKMKTAYLLLEDGTVYRGYSMGETGSAVGEVVFNTDMTTYQDLLMDPTYSGQIVVQTYPLIGNRGVDPVSETRLMASGYIVREWCVEPTDAHEFITLDAFLRQQHIVGLCGIDTRALTRHIRNHGVMNGVITDSLDNRESWIEQAKNYRVPPAVGKISVAAPVRYEAENARYELAVPTTAFAARCWNSSCSGAVPARCIPPILRHRSCWLLTRTASCCPTGRAIPGTIPRSWRSSRHWYPAIHRFSAGAWAIS